MKIAILNSSGNVGKSVISRELFYPRLENAEIVEVETVNAGSKELPQLRVMQFRAGDDFAELYLKIMTVENIIVDIGASNLSNFWVQMKTFAGIESIFDYFIVPTVPEPKEMTDTFKTLAFLEENEIDPSKVKVVFNKVKTTVDHDFALLVGAMKRDWDYRLEIPNSSVFSDLGFLRKTIEEIYNEDLNFYKEKILSEKDPQEKLKLVKIDLANRQAVGLRKRLDTIFEAITGKSVIVPSTPIKKTLTAKKEEVKKEAEEEFAVSGDDGDL